MRHFAGAGLLLIGLLGACSSNRANGPDSQCMLSSADAVYLGESPVYRECGVDRKARLTQNAPVDYRPAIVARTPSRGDVCYVAEVEFIVDPEGIPERNSIRLVRTTDTAYGNAVLSTIEKLRYGPALKDGMPVRQLVRERRTMALRAAPVASNPGARPNC